MLSFFIQCMQCQSRMHAIAKHSAAIFIRQCPFPSTKLGPDKLQKKAWVTVSPLTEVRASVMDVGSVRMAYPVRLRTSASSHSVELMSVEARSSPVSRSSRPLPTPGRRTTCYQREHVHFMQCTPSELDTIHLQPECGGALPRRLCFENWTWHGLHCKPFACTAPCRDVTPAVMSSLPEHTGTVGARPPYKSRSVCT